MAEIHVYHKTATSFNKYVSTMCQTFISEQNRRTKMLPFWSLQFRVRGKNKMLEGSKCYRK